jgi:hypothetical protein
MAAVCIPAPAIFSLAVFKDVTFVQAVPSYSSVALEFAVPLYPPKPNPAV